MHGQHGLPRRGTTISGGSSFTCSPLTGNRRSKEGPLCPSSVTPLSLAFFIGIVMVSSYSPTEGSEGKSQAGLPNPLTTRPRAISSPSYDETRAPLVPQSPLVFRAPAPSFNVVRGAGQAVSTTAPATIRLAGGIGASAMRAPACARALAVPRAKGSRRPERSRGASQTRTLAASCYGPGVDRGGSRYVTRDRLMKHQPAFGCAANAFPIDVWLTCEWRGRKVTVFNDDRTHPRFRGRIDLRLAAWRKLSGGQRPGLLKDVTVRLATKEEVPA